MRSAAPSAKGESGAAPAARKNCARAAAKRPSRRRRPLRAPKKPPPPGRRSVSEPGFLQSFILFRPLFSFWGYLQNVAVEIRKVSWPTRADARRLTGIVLIVTIAAAISLGLISFALAELFKLGIETPLILLATFAVIVAGTLFRLRRGARSPSF